MLRIYQKNKTTIDVQCMSSEKKHAQCIQHLHLDIGFSIHSSAIQHVILQSIIVTEAKILQHAQLLCKQ